jgi:hypothetical protein
VIGRADRWIRRTTIGCVGLLALIAGRCPICICMRWWRCTGSLGWVAALTPLSVDGMIVAASTTLLADSGQSRELAWARRPQAAALVAQLADPDRGWDAVVIGEYERAFCGGQYASMVADVEQA